jgi:hypothetical protein
VPQSTTSGAKSLAAGATVFILLKIREKRLKKKKCGLESGLQKEKKKGITGNN